MARSDAPEISELRALPSVNALMGTEQARVLSALLGTERVASLARSVVNDLRAEIISSTNYKSVASRVQLLDEASRRLERVGEIERRPGVRRVINATGVILHTNLGRAPLGAAVRAAMAEAAGYCTVEFDLEKGQRGPRGRRAEELLAELTGAEAGTIVNNGAAAALLVLTALSGGGEVILSRGELVEIGGDFRIPDVMARSGAQMEEVGTTNRTKLPDYESAITERTTMLMRVHPSNYRLVGFTAAPELKDLARLAHSRGVIFYEDAGSGALIDLAEAGITGEPVISDSIAAGADVVSFSGDKLLGGIQAGMIVGRAELLDRIRRHPLYRALRPDKTTLAAVEASLEIYRRGEARNEIPTLRMLAQTRESIATRAEVLAARLQADADPALQFELIPGESAIGGGAAPTTHPVTTLIALTHTSQTPDELAASLRRQKPPVIARIADDRVLIDLRTVLQEEEEELLTAVKAASEM